MIWGKEPFMNKSGDRDGKIKGFVVFPIVFCVLILSACTAFFYSSAQEFSEMSGGYVKDEEVPLSAEYYDIFVPAAEEEPEEEEPPEESGRAETKPNEQKVIPLSSINYPYFGQRFGEIIIEDCQIYATVYFGDSDYELNSGVGMYTGTYIPGYGRTIMVAGHNNMDFHNFKYAQVGQKVLFRTGYGNYTYEITDIQVKGETDSSAYDLDATTENLIMYTCYPFEQLNHTPYRCFVYAKLISGPVIDKNN